MAQNYIVPAIYQDLSDQYQGYFAFRFVCEHCRWQIDTRPVQSSIATTQNIVDLGAGLLGGFFGRAAEMGQKFYGSKWHEEQADALQKAWAQIQHNFHLCPRCHRTVCVRCFNVQLNLCTECAPDIKADGAQFQHQLNINAQQEQIQQHYEPPAFNVGAVPSAVTPDMLQPGSRQRQLSAGQPPQPPMPLAGAVPGAPQAVACPMCRRMGTPGKFCQDCGAKLPQLNLSCPGCAATIVPGTRFCSECGTKIQGS
ncbi:MAG: hypothetical protein NVS2B12_20400 [Ktedonobacteraceae bacterium]